MMVDSDTPEVTRRIFARYGEVGTNGEFIFSLPRRLKDPGMYPVHVEGDIDLVNDEAFAAFPESDYAFIRHVLLESAMADAQIAGIISAAEAQQWLAEQDQRACDGRFFLSVPGYHVVAMKPE